MKKLCLLLCFLPLAYGAHVTILRDEYGVPHIFAQDAAGAAFGSGYAQAEDRLEEMLKNDRLALTRLQDLRRLSRRITHQEIARQGARIGAVVGDLRRHEKDTGRLAPQPV